MNKILKANIWKSNEQVDYSLYFFVKNGKCRLRTELWVSLAASHFNKNAIFIPRIFVFSASFDSECKTLG